MPPTDASIPAVLADRARQQPDDIAYTFVDYEADPAGVSESLTWSEVHERAQIVAEKLAKIGSPGDRAVILAPQSLEYIIGFLGAIQAGFVAVPLSMPQTRHHDERVTGAMKDSEPVVVLTTSAVVDDVRRYGQADPAQRPPKFLDVDSLDFDSPPKPAPQASLPKTAYLQYTSGSTRSPAGVVVTHRNVLVNVEELLGDYYENYADGPPADTTIVSWLPFYHDMGLIVGVFIPMLLGRPAVLMSPVAFMQKPSRWMQLLGSNPSAFTAAPNFAFELAVKRTSDEDMADKDLSGVVVMINGAERVHGSTVRRFNERFAAFGLPDWAMRPSYGLAEATVYVAASHGGRPPTSVRFDVEKLSAGHAERCDDLEGTELIEVEPGEEPQSMEKDGITLSWVRTQHTDSSLAWRADVGPSSVTYTGDSCEVPEVVELAQGSHLFVCECSFADEHAIPTHLTPSSAARMARDAHVHCLLLTHFYPGLDPLEARAVAARTFEGSIEIAHDGSVHAF